MLLENIFSSPEHKVLRMRYCDQSLSVVVRRASSVVRKLFLLKHLLWKRSFRFWPNFTGMFPGWSPTKVVQIVPVGCISRSRGHKIGFQNAIFNNLIVLNNKAQSFHIWYIALSKGPLPKLFKICPWGQNWPWPGGHNFTLNYIRKLQTTSSEPLMGIWPN